MSGSDIFSQSVSATLLIFHNLQPEMNAWLASRQERIPHSSRRRFYFRASGALTYAGDAPDIKSTTRRGSCCCWSTQYHERCFRL